MASQAVEVPQSVLPAQGEPSCSTLFKADKGIVRKVLDERLDVSREL